MPTKTVRFLSDRALDRLDAESLQNLENVGVRAENKERKVAPPEWTE